MRRQSEEQAAFDRIPELITYGPYSRLVRCLPNQSEATLAVCPAMHIFESCPYIYLALRRNSASPVFANYSERQRIYLKSKSKYSTVFILKSL